MDPDLAHLVAVAAALGWASGLRLYAVRLPHRRCRRPRLGRAAGRPAPARKPVDAGRQRPDAVRRVLRRQDPGPRHALGRAAHADSHSRRRAARGRGVRRRPGELDDRRGPARRHARRDQPRRQGDARAAVNTSPEPSPTSPCRCSATAWCRWPCGCRGRIRSPSSCAGCRAGRRWSPPCAVLWQVPAPRRRQLAQRYRRPMSPPARIEVPPMSSLPSSVTLVDVGPRDGLQNEKQTGRRGDQDRARAAAPGGRPEGDRGHQLRQPEVGAADGRQRRRARRHRAASPACATRCWCRT